MCVAQAHGCPASVVVYGGRMAHFLCVVQAGSPAETASSELEARLTAMHSGTYPDDTVDFSWRMIPEGYMFTEGRQSTSSIISVSHPHPTDVVQREAYMRGVCDVWTELTGCTDHEIVVAVPEQPVEV